MLSLHRLKLLTAATAAALSLSACVVTPYGEGYAQVSPGVVTVAPPVAVVDSVGVAPYPGYVWIGGFWNWSGGRHVWVPGYWSAPRPGFSWVPHTWVREGGGYRLHEGHWAPNHR